VLPYLADAGLVSASPDTQTLQTLRAIAPLVQERCVVLSDAVRMLRFLFVPEEEFAVDPDAAAKNLGSDAVPIVEAALAALQSAPEWTAEAIEQALKSALVDGLGLKPRKAFAPIRVAVTGRTVSPPLYESMELLGKDRSLQRLRSALRYAREE
jgi:glutamyl-tRNA synthetase